jgi:hypothetical protein
MPDARLPDGRDRIVRRRSWPGAGIQTGIGPVAVRRVKLRDRDGGESGVPCASPRRSCRAGRDGPAAWMLCCPSSIYAASRPATSRKDRWSRRASRCCASRRGNHARRYDPAPAARRCHPSDGNFSSTPTPRSRRLRRRRERASESLTTTRARLDALPVDRRPRIEEEMDQARQRRASNRERLTSGFQWAGRLRQSHDGRPLCRRGPPIEAPSAAAALRRQHRARGFLSLRRKLASSKPKIFCVRYS